MSSNSDNKPNNWKVFCQKVGPGLKKTGNIFGTIWGWIFKLRKLILAIPVIVAAAMLAVRNSRQLPETVELIFFSESAYQSIPRNIAVLGPVAVTAVCLLLMMCSRKTLYPWIISIFSLILPVVIWLSTMYAF